MQEKKGILGQGKRCSRYGKEAVWTSSLGFADLLEPFLLLKPRLKMHRDSHGVEATNFHAFKRFTKTMLEEETAGGPDVSDWL